MSGQGRSPKQAAEAARREAESLFGFWAEAGVDMAFSDEPIDRLAERPRARPLSAAADPKPASAGTDVSGAIAEARRAAAEAHDLGTLAAAIAAFDGCGLKFEGARQAVFSRGVADAPVMVIGEAPGAEEDQSGQPFVGRAGKLLDKMLAAAGLADRVFITNTVFWRPSGNRNPTAQEQLVCAPFLERAIALVQPKLLFLAGGASAKAMLQRPEGILALRGRWFDWTSADGAITLPTLPTLHPAFLLRQPAAKKRAWSDLLMLSERLDRPERPPS